MVNASFDFGSIVGILIFLLGIFCFQLRKIKKKKKISNIDQLDFKLLGIVKISLLSSGFIIFFQSWRIEQPLKVVIFLTTIGIILELITNLLSESNSSSEPKNFKITGLDK